MSDSLKIPFRYADEDMQRQESQLNQQLRAIKAARDALQDEANEALPVGVQVLQEELEAAEEEKRSLIAQFAEVSRRLETVNLDQRPLIAEHHGVKSLIKDYNGRHAELVVSRAAARRAVGCLKYDIGHHAKCDREAYECAE